MRSRYWYSSWLGSGGVEGLLSMVVVDSEGGRLSALAFSVRKLTAWTLAVPFENEAEGAISEGCRSSG